MRKAEVARFGKITEKVQQVNRRHGYERFMIISTTERLNNRSPKRIPVYGLYDYKLKRYTLSEPFVDVNIILDEMEEMLSSKVVNNK